VSALRLLAWGFCAVFENVNEVVRELPEHDVATGNQLEIVLRLPGKLIAYQRRFGGFQLFELRGCQAIDECGSRMRGAG
jgi:hypothetical protein